MESIKLQRTPIYRAMSRPNLFMGCDRELVMSAILMCAVMGITLDPVAMTMSFLVAIISIYLLRKMGKSDPEMQQIYRRHIKHQDFYPARSSPFRIDN